MYIAQSTYILYMYFVLLENQREGKGVKETPKNVDNDYAAIKWNIQRSAGKKEWLFKDEVNIFYSSSDLRHMPGGHKEMSSILADQ